MFDLGVGAAAVALHVYLWKRLVADTAPPPWARRIAVCALLALLAVLLAALNLAETVGVSSASWFAWPGYLWLGLAIYLCLALAFLEPIRLILRRWSPQMTVAPYQDSDIGRESADTKMVSRRVFLARSGAAVAGAAALGVTGYGTATALGDPNLLEVPVRLHRLAPEFDGYRIAVVSDIHLGALSGRAHTARIVRMINETSPDLIAIIGDLVEDGTVHDLGHAAEPLRELRSRDGAYFVTGNHEYFVPDLPSWLQELERLGVRPLRNERVEIRRGNAAFDLAGVNDVTGAQSSDPPDYERALAGRSGKQPTILLAHQPSMITAAAAHQVDLVLAGHSHGGQMWPFHYLVALDQPALSGLLTMGDIQLYTSRGAGFWGPPLRVGAPPEITVITLRQHEQPAP